MNRTISRLGMIILLVVLMTAWGMPVFAEVGGYEPDQDINIKSQLNTQIDIKADHADNYYLDNTKAFGTFDKPLTSMANGCFDIYKLMIKANIDLTVKAFKFDLYSQLSTFIDTMLQPVKKTVYDGLAGITIAAGLLVILFVFLSRSATTGMGQLFTFLIVLVLSMFFLAYPAKTLSMGREFMLAISNNLIKNSFQVSYKVKTTDDALAMFANKQWEVLVEGPWKTLNFENSTIRGKYMPQLLTTPRGEMRDTIVETMRDESPANEAKWLSTTVVIMVLVIFTLLPIVALNGIMIASSALVLAITVLSPIIFCISYIPSFSRSFFSWVTRLFAMLAITVVATIGNTFILNLVDVLFKAMGNQYIVSVLFVSALIMIFLFLMRNYLFGIVTSPMHGQRAFDRSTRERTDLKHQGKSDLSDFKDNVKNTKKGTLKFINQSNKKLAAGEKSIVNGVKHAGDSVKKAGTWVSDKVNGKASEEEGFDYNAAAKDFGNQKYAREKAEAEASAKSLSEKTNMEVKPEYNDYVKSRMARDKMFRRGPAPTDLNAAVSRMKQYESVGLPPESIYEELDGISHDEIMKRGRKEQKEQKKKLNEEHERRQFRKQAGVNFEFKEDMVDRDYGREYLKAQFRMNLEQSNQTARNTAMQSGLDTKPEYDQFVQTGLERVKSGKRLYSGAELDRAENHMNEVRKKGMDPKAYLETMKPEDMSSFTGLKDKESKKVDIRNVGDGGAPLDSQTLKSIAKEAAKEAAKEVMKDKDSKGASNGGKGGHGKAHDHSDEVHDKLEKIADQQEALRDEMNQKILSRMKERSSSTESTRENSADEE